MPRTALLAAALLAGCGAAHPAAAPPRTAAPRSTLQAGGAGAGLLEPAGGIFGPASIWRTPVVGAPVAADSAAEVANLTAQVHGAYGGIAAFDAHQFPISFVTAAAGTPRVDVAFRDCQHRGAEEPGLAAQLAGVPIPAGAMPAAGSDHGLSVWQPSTDTLWELWEAYRTPSGWQACYGGRMGDVADSPGYFTGGFGESASGLSLTGGMLGLAEARAGRIEHALSLAIRDPAAGVSWPAQRTDGTATGPGAIREGTRLRLDPAVDVDGLPGLTPLAREVAHAAQTYGFIVTDTSGAVAVAGESGAATQAATGTDPWAALEAGVPDYEILQNFPWQDLEALPTNWGEPAGGGQP